MADTLEGKVCVITGATSGIGQVAAENLARMGVRLVLVARDERRGEAMLARLRAATPAIAHAIHYADLSGIAGTRRVAAEIAAAEPRIDILINNAGALFTARQVTADGLEKHFAVNHMAYHLLTEGLRDRLFASAPAIWTICRSRSATTACRLTGDRSSTISCGRASSPAVGPAGE